MGAHLENTKQKNPGLWRRLGPWVMMARQAALFSRGPLSRPVPSLHLHRTWGTKAEPCVSQNWYIWDTPAGILTHTRAGALTPSLP